MIAAHPVETAEQPRRRGVDRLLSDHHHRLEAKARSLLESAGGADTRALGVCWNGLEAELLDHMAAEEDVILPRYSAYAPADACRIRSEHARIRALLGSTGVDLELHQVRLARLRRLVDELEAHSASEDRAMYPWAVDHVGLVAERLLFARIRHSVGR